MPDHTTEKLKISTVLPLLGILLSYIGGREFSALLWTRRGGLLIQVFLYTCTCTCNFVHLQRHWVARVDMFSIKIIRTN